MPSGNDKPFYITTPIYYINAVPHIGHAYTTVLADTVARFQRLRGREVVLATGTDEHAEKIIRVAKDRGMTPRAYCDELADQWRECWCRLDITFDEFIRTSEPRHHAAVQEVFRRLLESGDVYKGQYEGWYCVTCATFHLETELLDGKCPNEECGHSPVEQRQQEAYFFAASRYCERLLAFLRANPGFIRPDFRQNEVLSFVEGGVHDACVSRPNDGWGVPIPGDEAHVVYVWFDALINYITVAGWPDDMERFERLWPADIHLMAKDILPRFHGSLWPMMLMALGIPLPGCVAAHGFWQMDGTKISKSLGNVVDPFALAQQLHDETGMTLDVALDAQRYFLLRETPFGQDASFTSETFRARLNADLANDLGNALNRVLPIVARSLGGVIPEGEMDPALAAGITRAASAVNAGTEALDFRGALDGVWNLIGQLNKYIDTQAPWNLAKDEARRDVLCNVAFSGLETLRCVTVLLAPYIPHAAGEMRLQLGLPPAVEGVFDALAAPRGEAIAGNAVSAGSPVFPRVDKATTRADAGATPASKLEKEPQPVTETISYDDFAKLALRVGTVLAGERVEGADKLYALKVDLGEPEPRSIVAGLAQDFPLDELVGRQIVVVANLEPRKVRGVLSQGMLLAVTNSETDRPCAIVTVDRPAAPGSGIR